MTAAPTITARRKRQRMEYPSKEEIEDFLSYDPITGIFRWKKILCRKHCTPGKRAGTKKKHYRVITARGIGYYEHVLAWIICNGPLPDGMQVDHINGNRLDNRIENLRLATPAQQMMNKAPNKTKKVPVKGVAQIGKRWGAKIQQNRETIHLGRFATIQEASDAYNRAALERFGQFARLSIVPQHIAEQFATK